MGAGGGPVTNEQTNPSVQQQPTTTDAQPDKRTNANAASNTYRREMNQKRERS